MTKRLAGIDGVRGIAASMVVLYHVWLYTPPFDGRSGVGALDAFARHLWVGVTIFFVLSGFLLYRPFAAAIIRGGPAPSLRRYAVSRALRILPAYYSALTIVIVVLHRHLLYGSPWEWAKDYLFLQIYFPRTTETVIGPAWTLCVEVTFYAALPLLAWLVGAWARPGSSALQRARRQVAPLIVLVEIGIAYRAGVLALPGRLPIALPEFIDLFAVGMLLAVAFEYRRAEDPGRSLDRVASRLLWIAALAAAAAAAAVAHPSALPLDGDPLQSALFDPLVAVSVACLLATMVLCERSLLVRVCSLRPLASLGAVSYGLYLWHEPLLTVGYSAFEYGPIRWQIASPAAFAHAFAWATPLALALALSTAAFSWRRLERPLLELKPRS